MPPGFGSSCLKITSAVPGHRSSSKRAVSLRLPPPASPRPPETRPEVPPPIPADSGPQYHDLVENSADLIGIHDTAGVILMANRAMARFLGVESPEAAAGRNLSEFIAPAARENLLAYLRQVFAEGAARGHLEFGGAGGGHVVEYNNSLRHGGAGIPAARWFGRDVTQYRAMESQLNRKIEQERIIAVISSDFLTISHEEIDEAIGRALATIGRFLGSDRAWVLRFLPGWTRAEVVHWWRRDGKPLASGRHRHLRMESFSWAAEKIRWFENVQIPSPQALPAAARAERRLISGNGLSAALAVPLVLSGSVAGALCVGWKSGETGLPEDSPALVKITGEILVNAMERQRAESALRVSERRYRRLFEGNLAGVYRSDLAGRVLDCNNACARTLGFASREEMLAYGALDIYFNLAERESVVNRLQENQTLANLEVCLKRRDGQPVWVLENVSLLRSDESREPYLEGTLIDITDRKEAQAQVEHQATHDALTGLVNRAVLTDRVTQTLAQAQRARRRPAVAFLDLDHFKDVNDTLGHAAGDELLRAVAARLAECVREDDTVARVGGDEFVFLLQAVADAEGAIKVADKIITALSAPFLIGGQPVHATCSIGIALYPRDGEDAATLLKNADGAMYRAKNAGRNNFQLCDPGLRQRAANRLTLEKNLSQALDRGEFQLYFQPQVAARSGKVVGCEALLRWRHPERGVVSPEEFIAIAEENRQILPLGQWVLRTALTQGEQWLRQGFSNLRIGVNLSARQFEQPQLARLIGDDIRAARFPPEKLELEITETVAMENAGRTATIFAELRELGVQVSIDDFGTGQSSISYLRRYPIHSLKIDKSFVRDAAINPADAAIVRALTDIAHGLHLRVVAEGVETEVQRKLLQEWNRDELQGYLVGRPMPAPQFFQFLRQSSVR